MAVGLMPWPPVAGASRQVHISVIMIAQIAPITITEICRIYAFRVGATGLTFYDDEVTAFFSPDAAGRNCIVVVALGESVRRMLPLA